LRALCAAAAPARVEFFRYDWKRAGGWNIAFATGILLGAALAVLLLNGGAAPAISGATRAALGTLGISPPAGFLPAELFAWPALFTVRGASCVLGGGFLAGFGSAYAGGCTSGHGVLGLASREPASVVALIGIFAGGMFATFVVLPLIL
jgi:uncharacterized membrane protein YedE/YeeE